MKFFIVVALAIASVSADVSHLQKKDESGYHYDKPATEFVEKAYEAEPLPEKDYLPPIPTVAPRPPPPPPATRPPPPPPPPAPTTPRYVEPEPEQCPNGGSGEYCCINGASNPDCCDNGGYGKFCCTNGVENEYCCDNGANNPDCTVEEPAQPPVDYLPPTPDYLPPKPDYLPPPTPGTVKKDDGYHYDVPAKRFRYRRLRL